MPVAEFLFHVDQMFDLGFSRAQDKDEQVKRHVFGLVDAVRHGGEGHQKQMFLLDLLGEMDALAFLRVDDEYGFEGLFSEFHNGDSLAPIGFC